MNKYILHDDHHTQWIMFARDPSKNSAVIDTNEYLIISGDEGIILDPGGTEVFPPVLTAVSEVIDIRKITSYLCSHQDPDIMSSLPLWLGLTPEAKIYMSWLWGGFVSHFGSEFVKNFKDVQDEGCTITLGGRNFQIVPAHFCHSPGNLNLFDPKARILFSGDMGAALLPNDYPIFVENFNDHIKYMEKFHIRWMPSNAAKNSWVKRVRKLNPQMLCPQHGSIFKNENVTKFLDWIEDLEVGKTNAIES